MVALTMLDGEPMLVAATTGDTSVLQGDETFNGEVLSGARRRTA